MHTSVQCHRSDTLKIQAATNVMWYDSPLLQCSMIQRDLFQLDLIQHGLNQPSAIKSDTMWWTRTWCHVIQYGTVALAWEGTFISKSCCRYGETDTPPSRSKLGRDPWQEPAADQHWGWGSVIEKQFREENRFSYKIIGQLLQVTFLNNNRHRTCV